MYMYYLFILFYIIYLWTGYESNSTTHYNSNEYEKYNIKVSKHQTIYKIDKWQLYKK